MPKKPRKQKKGKADEQQVTDISVPVQIQVTDTSLLPVQIQVTDTSLPEQKESDHSAMSKAAVKQEELDEPIIQRVSQPVSVAVAVETKTPKKEGIDVQKVITGFLLVIDLILMICGCAALAVGIIIVTNSEKVAWINDVIGTSSMNIDVLCSGAEILITAAGVLIVMGFFGCYGALRFHITFLQMHTLFMLALLVCEVAAIILGVVFFRMLDDTVKGKMNGSLQTFYGLPDYNKTTVGWDSMQTMFKCCGTDSYKDYEKSNFVKAENGTYYIPLSCCVKDVTDMLCQNNAKTGTEDSTYYYHKGCYEKLKEWVRSNSMQLITLCSVIATLQLFVVVTICYRLRNDADCMDWLCVCL